MDAAEKSAVLARLNAWGKNTLLETLSIEFVDVGADFLTATMPVGPVVYQLPAMLAPACGGGGSSNTRDPAPEAFID